MTLSRAIAIGIIMILPVACRVIYQSAFEAKLSDRLGLAFAGGVLLAAAAWFIQVYYSWG